MNKKESKMTKAQLFRTDNEKLNRWSNLAKARGEKEVFVSVIINRLIKNWELNNMNEEYPKQQTKTPE